jgi:pimeloyl-ACP methyl ester carboxylesterase
MDVTAAAAATDRLVLRAIERLFVLGRRPAARAQEQRRAAELYGDPELLADPRRFFPYPADVPAVVVERRRPLPGGAEWSLRFQSGYRTFDPTFQARYDKSCERNRTVDLRGFFHEGGGAAPVAVCINGWRTGQHAIEQLLFRASTLYQAGIDVLLFPLPFHGPRAPAWRGSGALFPSPSVSVTAEAFGQAIWDLRRTLLWLRQTRRAAAVGVIGMSVGGYAASLLAALERDLSFVVPFVPLVSLAELMWTHGEGRPERIRAEQNGVTKASLERAFGVHSALRLPPPRRERSLIIAGRGDAVCFPEQVMALWEHWQQPRIHWFAGGHVLQLGRGAAFREIVSFLRDIDVLHSVPRAAPPVGGRA